MKREPLPFKERKCTVGMWMMEKHVILRVAAGKILKLSGSEESQTSTTRRKVS